VSCFTSWDRTPGNHWVRCRVGPGAGLESVENINKYLLPGVGVKARPARKADKVTTICLDNVGTSTSHNPIDLHGLLQG
jgi:hypothetical protein